MTVCHNPPLCHVWCITQLRSELHFCAESPHHTLYLHFQLNDLSYLSTNPDYKLDYVQLCCVILLLHLLVTNSS